MRNDNNSLSREASPQTGGQWPAGESSMTRINGRVSLGFGARLQRCGNHRDAAGELNGTAAASGQGPRRFGWLRMAAVAVAWPRSLVAGWTAWESGSGGSSVFPIVTCDGRMVLFRVRRLVRTRIVGNKVEKASGSATHLTLDTSDA